MRAPDLAIPHQRVRLDNGLTVILHQDRTLPQVAINLWVNVGSKDEEPGRTGFAHLFEHLMFTGTRRVPGAAFDDLMEAHGGWNNAWTSEDCTDFQSGGPSHLTRRLLWLEADRFAELGLAMDQVKLDIQREVVRNERRQSMEDAPYGGAWLAMPEAMYPAGHPYAHPIIGSHEDLLAAGVEEVRTFFDSWYTPGNASLVVAGDFDPEDTLSWIRATFGLIPGRASPRQPTLVPVDRPVTSTLTLQDRVSVPMSLLAWHSPALLTAGDAAMDMLAAILGDGRTSRLDRRLIHEERAVLDLDVHQASQTLGSYFLVDTRIAEDREAEEIEALVHEEIGRIAREGPAPSELDRARNDLELDLLHGVESIQGRAAALNRYQAHLGNPDGMRADLERYRQLTPEDIAAAAACLRPERALILRVDPIPEQP